MEYWLPIFFMEAMGEAMAAYVILDGYDLGIGLLPLADTAVSSWSTMCSKSLSEP